MEGPPEDEGYFFGSDLGEEVPPLPQLDLALQATLILLLNSLQHPASTSALTDSLERLEVILESEKSKDRITTCFLGNQLKIGSDVLLPVMISYAIDDQILSMLVRILNMLLKPLMDTPDLDARAEQMLFAFQLETKQAFVDHSAAQYLLQGMTRTLLFDMNMKPIRLLSYFLLLKNLLLISDAPSTAVVSEAHLSRLQDSLIQSLAKERVLAFLLMNESSFFEVDMRQHYMEILSLILSGTQASEMYDQSAFVAQQTTPDTELKVIKMNWETHIYHQWQLNEDRKKQKPIAYQPHLQRHFRPVYARWHPIWGRKLCNSVHELTNSIYARFDRQTEDAHKTSKYLPVLRGQLDQHPTASFESKVALKSFVDTFLDRCLFQELFDFRKFRKSLPDTQQALYWYLAGWFLDYVGRSVRHQRMLRTYRQQPPPQLGGQQGTPGILLAEQSTRELMQAVCSYITLSSFKHAFEMAKEYAEEYAWSVLHYNIAALSNMLIVATLMSKCQHLCTVVDEVIISLVRHDKKYIRFLIRLLKNYRPRDLSKSYLGNLVFCVGSLLAMSETISLQQSRTLTVMSTLKKGRASKKSKTGKPTVASSTKEVNLNGIITALASPLVIRNCCYLLEDYFTNEPDVNMDIIYILQTIARHNSGQYIKLFFQMTILAIFLKIKSDRYIQPTSKVLTEVLPECDPLWGKQKAQAFATILSFIDFIIGRFIEAAKHDPFVWIEGLFRPSG